MVEIIDFEKRFEEEYVNVHNTAFDDSCYVRVNWPQHIDGVGKKVEKIYLARYLDKIIGEITLTYGDYENSFCIGSVSVLPEHRRKGIGSMLIERAEEYTKSKSKNIIGEIIDSGDELTRFYQKRGYLLNYVRYGVTTEKEHFKFIPMEEVMKITEPIKEFKTWLLMGKNLGV